MKKKDKKIITAICIGCLVVMVYLIACWIDVVAHNNSDHKYGKWNVISLVWGKEEPTTEIITVDNTTTEYSEEVTTEHTTELTTVAARTVTVSHTTELTTEVTTETEQFTEISTTEEITTEYYVEETTTEVPVTTTEMIVVTSSDPGYAYNSDEVEMLAHLINGEAGASWCSDTTRYYVGSVVLNRVNHPEFPDTIAGVIWQSGQYACTWDGNYDLTPSDRCYEIARDLLENGSWLPADVVFQANFSQGSGVYDYIDGVYFCYR